MTKQISPILPGLIAALVAVLCPATISGQTPAPEPQLRVSGVELSVGGRLHAQFNTTSIADQPPSQLFLRRARLEIGVKVNEVVSGVLQPDFGNEEVELKDAYLELAFAPSLNLRAGKAYRPFGLLEQTSSKRILPIERGLRIRGLRAADEYALTSGLGYSNRDIGLQVLGAPEGAPLDAAYAVGVFRGPLHGSVGAQDSYQLAARVTARPLRSLRLGAGWSSRDFAASTDDTPELDRGHAFEVDLEYGAFAPGFHLLAELSTGDLDPFSDATFNAAQTWIAYRTAELNPTVTAVEPVLRLSYGETNDGGLDAVVPGGTLVTPGINIYFGPLNRIMLNYDVWDGAGRSGNARSFKAMFQLGF